MNKRNILITGGAGFIGSHLVDKLIYEGNWNVTVVDNFSNFYSPLVKFRNIEKHFTNESFQFVFADICNLNSLNQLFKNNQFEVIVHLAACAGVRPSIRQPEQYAETNINGTLNLLNYARRNDVRQFVFGSSSSVYGINSEVPFSEEMPVNKPVSPYAATKAAGELLCHTYSYLYGLRCICLRFFTVYGARQRPDLAIHKFARLISQGLEVPVFGNGTTSRDYTYIDDIIQGIRAAIDYSKSNFEIFNLGESRTIKLFELIKILENELGKKAMIKYEADQPGDVPQTFANIEKAKTMLGYQPSTDFEKGIKNFIEWFNIECDYSLEYKVAKKYKSLSIST